MAVIRAVIDVVGAKDAGKELEHNYSLNTVDICPVGALTSTDFRFKMRVWFLKRTNSICTESSVGANSEIWSREGKIYRVTPRRNDAVNDTWMTDTGREIFKAVESEDRLTHYTIDGVHQTDDETAVAAAKLLKSGNVALIGSAQSSVEEQYFYKLIADRSEASVSLISHIGAGDGILLSEDRTPNLRGALLNGLIAKLPEADLAATARGIQSGAVKTLVVVNQDVTELGIPADLLAKVKVIYFGTHANETSKVADVVCPSLMVFEKDGSFVNQSFRLQKFKAAVPGPRGIHSDFSVLEKIVAALDDEQPAAPTLDGVWQQIAENVSAFTAQSWRGISDEGIALDPAAFLDLPFVETKNLKFDPVAFKEAQAASAQA